MGLPGGMPIDLGPLALLGQSIAGNLMQDMLQAMVGNDLSGLMQLAVGMMDGLFGDMKPEEVVHTLTLSSQVINTMIEKYAAMIPQQETPAVEMPGPTIIDDGYEDGGELNHLIHEGRAAKRGVLWNRERGRYETPAHQPLFWNADGSYREVSEEEWAQHEAATDEAVRHQYQTG